jgi:hypothetical protein
MAAQLPQISMCCHWCGRIHTMLICYSTLSGADEEDNPIAEGLELKLYTWDSLRAW